jgi:hypothetical protein
MAIERWETELESGIGRGEALRVVLGCAFVVGLLLAGWFLG